MVFRMKKYFTDPHWLNKDTNLEKYFQAKDELSGADIRVVFVLIIAQILEDVQYKLVFVGSECEVSM